MTQRIYWVPHTLCPFGCDHCHNDSSPAGVRASRDLIERIVAHLPGSDSPYRLEEMLVGGGEALVRGADMEYLVKAFRQRFPQGSQPTAEERRAAGHVILALQTAGPPLADSAGRAVAKRIDYWLDLGVDYFQVASSDRFHRGRRPNYPWEALERSLVEYGGAYPEQADGLFMIYGKSITRLVPSGRVLSNLDKLRAMGARLLTEGRYCADGWETGSHFLTGQALDYPQCAEAVIDPQGWVHPCCWYLLSPGLFNVGETSFEVGMEALRSRPLCQALDGGDLATVAETAGLDAAWAEKVRDAVGDCGLCRLATLALAGRDGYEWLEVAPLSDLERAFYEEYLGAELGERIPPFR